MESEEPIPAVTPGVFVGPDRIFRRGGQIVIDSPSEMPDWQVRTFRRTRIEYEGAGYFVARKALLKKGRWRHVLEPWPEEPTDPPWTEIRYGPAWVAERDEHERAIRARRKAIPFLWALWPFAGLLPSPVQAVLHDRYGITPSEAVERSLYLEWLGVILAAGALAIATWTGLFGSGWPIGIMLLLLADQIARHHALINEDPNPPGFCEWIWLGLADGVRRIRDRFQ